MPREAIEHAAELWYRFRVAMIERDRKGFSEASYQEELKACEWYRSPDGLRALRQSGVSPQALVSQFKKQLQEINTPPIRSTTGTAFPSARRILRRLKSANKELLV